MTAPGVVKLLLVLFLVQGILECVAGRRMFRFCLFLNGFWLMGPMLGILPSLNSRDFAVDSLTFLLAGLVGGAAFAGVYLVGLFLMGFMGTAILAMAVTAAFKSGLDLAALLLVSALGGAGTLAQRRAGVQASTAFLGAARILLAIVLLHRFQVPQLLRDVWYFQVSQNPSLFLVWIALGGLGILIQTNSLPGSVLAEALCGWWTRTFKGTPLETMALGRWGWGWEEEIRDLGGFPRGGSQVGGSPVPVAGPTALPPGAAVVIRVTGPLSLEKSFRRLPISIGRRDDNDIVLLCPPHSDAISRQQARIEGSLESLTVVNCGSQRLLMVGGQPVDSSPLRSGDSFMIGPFQFHILIAPSAGRP